MSTIDGCILDGVALLINLLDDPYDHDRCGIQFDCNERHRELCFSKIADCKPATPPTQPNLSDDSVKLGDFVVMNT
jgi:hypothetical protein